MEHAAPRIPASADIREAFLGASRRYLLGDVADKWIENQALTFSPSPYPSGIAGLQDRDGAHAVPDSLSVFPRNATRTRHDFPQSCCCPR